MKIRDLNYGKTHSLLKYIIDMNIINKYINTVLFAESLDKLFTKLPFPFLTSS